jgi:hypothetical protein
MNQLFINAKNALICYFGAFVDEKVRFSEIAEDVDKRLRLMIQDLTDKYAGKE